NEETLMGYEIHMGRTTGDVGLFALKRISPHPDIGTMNSEFILDGSARGNVWGTYIHGIFDNDGFRRNLINVLRKDRGLVASEARVDYTLVRDQSLENGRRFSGRTSI